MRQQVIVSKPFIVGHGIRLVRGKRYRLCNAAGDQAGAGACSTRLARELKNEAKGFAFLLKKSDVRGLKSDV